jgi:hypothetical protein
VLAIRKKEQTMDYRQLGYSGLKVSELSFGTGTFGGGTEFFRAWGETDVNEAKRLIDICLEAGINLFDTADIYSNGLSEEILGKAVAGKRQELLISSKTTFRLGDGPNDVGSSRHHILRACDASLRRLGTDYIDIYHMHGFDELTPVEETLETLDTLVCCGKVRYIACSNFSGWHLMKSLSISQRYGWARYVRVVATRGRPKGGCLGLESTRLGTIDRKDPQRPALAAAKSPAQNSGNGAAGARRIRLQSRGRDRRDCQGDWKNRSTSRAELAASPADRFERDTRRAQRRATAAKPGSYRLEADSGTSG